MSPVHNDYKKHKKSLIDYQDRRAMVELATQNTWIKCSVWEGKQSSWTPTRQVGELLSESLFALLDNGLLEGSWGFK